MQKSLHDKCDRFEELFVTLCSHRVAEEKTRICAKDFTSIVNDFCSFSGPVFDICYHVLFTLSQQPQLNAQRTQLFNWSHSYSPTFALVELTIRSVCFCRRSSFVVILVELVFLSDEWSGIARVLNPFAMALFYLSLFAIIFHVIYLTHSFDTCFRFDFIFIRLHQTVDLYWFTFDGTFFKTIDVIVVSNQQNKRKTEQWHEVVKNEQSSAQKNISTRPNSHWSFIVRRNSNEE